MEVALTLRLNPFVSIPTAAAAEFWAATLAVIMRHQLRTYIVADCQAVIDTWTTGDPTSYKCAHAGAWREQRTHTLITGCRKVQPHQSWSRAKEEGWVTDWIGNTIADSWAGRASAITNHAESGTTSNTSSSENRSAVLPCPP
jgi:hypothetical protein